MLFPDNSMPGRHAAMLLLFVLLCLAGSGALAQVDTFEFDTPEQEERFRQLSNELRCPMCQNTNLSGSTGGVAADLRREVHRMIMEGMTDEEIEQFMFERYGDFIFYRPRLRTDTLLLWFGPLIFLLIGGLVAWSIWRKAQSAGDSETDLDSEQQQKLRELLDDNNNSTPGEGR